VDKPLFKTILEEKTNNFVSSRTAIPGFIVGNHSLTITVVNRTYFAGFNTSMDVMQCDVAIQKPAAHKNLKPIESQGFF
jgi:hypothetical protein